MRKIPTDSICIWFHIVFYISLFVLPKMAQVGAESIWKNTAPSWTYSIKKSDDSNEDLNGQNMK